MDVAFATDPGGTGPNEDFAAASPDVVVVLDGLTAPAELGTGCVHGTPWYVARLGARVLAELSGRPEVGLAAGLAGAIEAVAAEHAGSCDLGHPGTPSATVALLRDGGGRVDYLALADAVVVVDVAGEVEAVADRRVDRFAVAEAARVRASTPGSAERRRRVAELVAAQRPVRNRQGGYWIAGADPGAAEHALVGSVGRAGLARAALLTDGASRFTEVLGLGDWVALLDELEKAGPAGLLRRVRSAEDGDPDGVRWPRFKHHDDATAALCTWPR